MRLTVESVAILVCGNGGAAGQELLRGDGVDLHWALNAAEADAALRSGRPRVIVASQALALQVLALERPADTAALILVEPDGWSKRQSYLDAGATALVQSDGLERAVGALSTLTGLEFSRAPRVRFESVVEIPEGDGDTRLIETIDISTAGVAVCGIPDPTIGMGVTLNFTMEDEPFEVQALVVRCFDHGGERAAGLAFCGPSAHLQSRLQEIVENNKTQRDRPISIPVANRTNTLAAIPRIDPDVLGALQARVAGDAGSKIPAWAVHTAGRLTPVERAALVGAPTESWARRALDLRLALAEAAALGDLTEALRAQGLKTCRALADRAGGAEPAVLAQVTRVRADIMRLVHSDERTGRAIDGQRRAA